MAAEKKCKKCPDPSQLQSHAGQHGNRLLVSLNYMEQGVSIEIDDFMVEPV